MDWDSDGAANDSDEWIEIYNCSGEDLDLGGCALDDIAIAGSAHFVFPSGTMLAAGAYRVYYQKDTGIILNNDGDSVRLLSPDGSVADMISYEQVVHDASYSRTRGCAGEWVSIWPPSPGKPNDHLPGDELLFLPLIEVSRSSPG